MSNLTKKELYAYAFKKAGEVNSIEGKYLHRNIYKAFVCPPIERGIATTYEDVDKLIEENTTDDPKTTDDYAHEQILNDMRERQGVFADLCSTLNDDEVAAIKKVLNMMTYPYYEDLDFETLKKLYKNN